MNKRALVTLNIGNFLHQNSRDSFHDAARRWGCDYIEITQSDTEPVSAMKMKVFELCDADRVFYIDADAVISAGCPSPFETFPDDGFAAVDNQQDQMTESCRTACADNIARDLLMIMKWRGLGEKRNYIDRFVNSGVWLASRRHHTEMLKIAYDVSVGMNGQMAWMDQSALNYALIHTNTAVLFAPTSWNYQFPPDTGSNPMQKHIYHWAGGEDRDQIDGINWRSFAHIEPGYSKPRLLVIADHGVPTGFARVAENVCAELSKRWDVHVIGINYIGAPHKFSYPVWPANMRGDIWGLQTYAYLLPEIKPDAVLTVQDPWIAARYLNEVDRGPIPFVAYMPIDAKNQHPGTCNVLNKLDMALFYTQFGEMELRLAGYKGPSHVIPHGVDTDIYRPLDRKEARKQLFGDAIPENAFVVGNVNRNQPRKRLDLTIQYFAEWLRRVAGDPRQRIDDAYLYLHCSQRDTMGWDLPELAYYYGVSRKLIIPDIEAVTPRDGLPEEEMPYVYSAFDIQVSTTAGEGFGLIQIEGMACGIPQIVPQFAALGEWAAPGAYLVPVTDERIAHSMINTIGAIPDKDEFIRAMDLLYKDKRLRAEYSSRAIELAQQSRFQWGNVADQFDKYLKEAIVIARDRWDKRQSEKKEKKQDAEVQEKVGLSAVR